MDRTFDLVIQGPGLAASALPQAALELSAERVPAGPGAVRLRAVDPARARALLPGLDALGLDAAVVPAGLLLTDFRVAASDFDSTLCAEETLDQVALREGYGEEVARVTDRAMRGEIRNYSESLRERIRLIAGCPERAFTDYASGLRYNPGAETLMAAFRAAGLRRYIVSAGFDQIMEAGARHFAAEGWRCNRLEVKDGVLTGRVAGPQENGGEIIDGEGKRRMVEQLCRDAGAEPQQLITLGDGWNDVPMLRFAGLGVAYHAKPRVRALVALQVNHLGLDSVLSWFEDGEHWRQAALAGG